MVRTISSVAAIMLCVSTVVAQQSAPTSGVIAGRLTSADQGQPVRKAQVRLTSASPRQTRTMATDAEGRFSFPQLPAGDYTLVATKPGYLEMAYGARRPGGGVPGVSIKLASGQQIAEIVIRTPRGGVISGVVTDEFGDPAFGVPVRSMRFGYENGVRVAQPAAMATTDDLGAYRIAGLLPGEYVVSAVPRDSVAAAAASAELLRARQAQMLAEGRASGTDRALAASFERARQELGRVPAAPPVAKGYVAVYHPSSATPGGATRVSVGVSEQLSAVDIQLQALATGSVTGTITRPDGAPVSGRVQLLAPGMPIANLAVWFRTAGSNGRFTFHGVPPGAYVVSAQTTAGKPGQELTATVGVQVSEGGTHDVVLAVRAGVSASGSVDLASLRGVDLRRVQVDLMKISTAAEWEVPLGTAIPDAEGRFVIHGLSPGLYRIGVRGLPNGWSLQSAVFDDTDAADRHLRIETQPVTGGVLTFTMRRGVASGVVTSGAGRPVSDHSVLVFPADAELWVPQSRRIHVAQPDAEGRYAIQNLPPGEYRIAVVVPPEPGQQFDHDFLSQAARGATAIAIAAGAQKTQDLTVR